MDRVQNFYAILGVSPEASQDDIRDAYRVAARRFHPDANPNKGADIQFRDIAAAYEVLGNAASRAQYDLTYRKLREEPPYFSLRVTPSKRVLSVLNEPQVVYLLLEIVAMRQGQPEKKRETQLNLVLVLDRSTSMNGVRLERVKVAAHQIIEQLTPDDVFSVVSFSDFPEVLIPASRISDKVSMKATVTMMRADGGTSIFPALQAGLEECRRFLDRKRVNHIILLTDGRTYGDEKKCLELAEEAPKEVIGISAMGIGEEWNDDFLDALASTTGGTSTYVNTPAAVERFLNQRVRSLGDAFVDRVQVSIAPDADVVLESVFKLHPNPQPVEIDTQPLQLGMLQVNKTLGLLIQLQMPPGRKTGFRTMARLDVTGDVLAANRQAYQVLSDISIEISEKPQSEEPPLAILDALGKLTLYRMQQKAQASIDAGNVLEATRRLENLATRLLAAGQDALAQRAISEAKRVSKTNMLSEEGRKSLKFGTRMLLAQPSPGENEQ